MCFNAMYAEVMVHKILAYRLGVDSPDNITN